MSLNEFFVRYYVGHRGAFGHEFLQFEIHSDGRLRYANNSKYKQAGLIKKECFVSDAVLTELRRIIDDSEILKEDDNLWPEPDANGKQELEIVTESDHISFMEKCDDEDNAMSYWTSKLGSLLQVQDSKDPEGLRNFYYLIQDLKCFVFALIHMHFKFSTLLCIAVCWLCLLTWTQIKPIT